MIMRFGILTVSDRSFRGERADSSGPVLVDIVTQKGWQVIKMEVIPDEVEIIQDKLSAWADSNRMDIILTTGGTGFSPRDVTPEATQAVIHRHAPGLVEVMRAESLKVTSHAMLSRAEAGIRGRTLIINLPGNPKGAVENLRVILPVLSHAIQLLKEDPQSETSHNFEK